MTGTTQAAEGRATVPPQHLEAEESVLGAMMLSPSAVVRAGEALDASDFYRESHGLIFRAAVALEAQGEPVDAITLTAELSKRGELDRVGGRVRLNELARLVPASANVGHYCKIVRDAATMRGLIQAGSKITQLGWDAEGDPDELLGKAERIVDQLSNRSTPGDFSALSEATGDLLAEITQAVETSQPIFGLRTGFPDLDSLLTGLHPGQLVVVAARPGVGKSVLCQNISENVADRGTPVGFFSLEMSKRELQLRSIVRKTRIELGRLRTGKITVDELDLVKKVVNETRERPFYVEDDASITPTELRARARRLKAKHGLGLLVVDYLQLMVGESNRDKKNDEIAAISRSLKLLAKELQVPVIAVSQLNRNAEFRSDKRPTLADLRDSGAIEQDADVVVFIYRDELYNQVEPQKASDAELIVAKNRMGESKTVKTLFIGRRQTFATPTLPGTGGTSA